MLCIFSPEKSDGFSRVRTRDLEGCPLIDTKTQRGGTGIALLYPDVGARREWVVSTTLQPLHPDKGPV
jgi:hypothetical protein